MKTSVWWGFPIGALILSVSPLVAAAAEGDPVAIRFWPGGGVSVETVWDLHVAHRVSVDASRKLPRSADLELSDAAGSFGGKWRQVLSSMPAGTHVLDRAANSAAVTWGESGEAEVSPHAVRVTHLSRKHLSTTRIEADGVRILILSGTPRDKRWDLISGTDADDEPPVDVLVIPGFGPAEQQRGTAALETWVGTIKPRFVITRGGHAGSSPAQLIAHNTFAVSAGDVGEDGPRWVALGDRPWEMNDELSALFEKKEAACEASRNVFSKLSVAQMNFRPPNGTHTPRWNAEHMMGRELLFFSQIYHAADANIPVIDLNPQQMPPDYKAAHSDWDGAEEARQMARVEAFTRRFAYLLDGMDLDTKAVGSKFWTPRALLKQMEAHYAQHTANVVKKMSLEEWPSDE